MMRRPDFGDRFGRGKRKGAAKMYLVESIRSGSMYIIMNPPNKRVMTIAGGLLALGPSRAAVGGRENRSRRVRKRK